uniref:Fanconi-associated nuclease n=1 Tax=Acrobeloides nanus TaxID=290746 RepID=A0A914DF53_9BILA
MMRFRYFGCLLCTRVTEVYEAPEKRSDTPEVICYDAPSMNNTEVVPETPISQQGILKHEERRKIDKYSSTPSTSNSLQAVKKRVTLTRTVKKSPLKKPSKEHPYVNIPLEEVYEQLISQLESLCDAGSKADIILSQQSQIQLTSQEKPAEDVVENATNKFGPPYVLKYFWRMCLRVLRKDSGITNVPYAFWRENLRILYGLITMPAVFQEPFIRMLLKDCTWTSPDKIKNSSAANWPNNSDVVNEVFTQLIAYHLVDPVDSGSIKLEEAVRLLSKEALEKLCKNFKLDHKKGRPSLIDSLIKHAEKKNCFGSNIEKMVFKKVLEDLGCYYKIKQPVYDFLHAIFTLYSPTNMDSSQLNDDPRAKLAGKLTFLMLNHELNKVIYPAPRLISKCLSIHKTYLDLHGLIKANHLEIKIIQAVESRKFQVACDLGNEAKCILENTFLKAKENLLEEIPSFLWRFTTPWVLMRCIGYMVNSLERMRKYDEAVELLRFLLLTKGLERLCPNSRGQWFDRLALNLQSHLKKPDEALEACTIGLNDVSVKDKDKVLLQDRAIKLVKDGTSFIPVVVFEEPDKVTIEGEVLAKEIGDQRINHFILPNSTDDGTIQNCRVEDVALHYFLNQREFDEGVHGEGQPWHSLFGLLCYDIIFDHSVPGVWFSELQIHPVDLTTPYLYSNRKEKFDARFDFLLNADKKTLEELVSKHYEEHFNEQNTEVSWELFTNLEQIHRFLSCCEPNMLVALFKRMVMDYRSVRSGFPDLVVWNASKKKLAVIEVKGPGDKLSTKQRLWLDFFSKNGVEAKVCHVVANNNRRL